MRGSRGRGQGCRGPWKIISSASCYRNKQFDPPPPHPWKSWTWKIVIFTEITIGTPLSLFLAELFLSYMYICYVL